MQPPPAILNSCEKSFWKSTFIQVCN
jgi:hypothetical protein